MSHIDHYVCDDCGAVLYATDEPSSPSVSARTGDLDLDFCSWICAEHYAHEQTTTHRFTVTWADSAIEAALVTLQRMRDDSPNPAVSEACAIAVGMVDQFLAANKGRAR